MYALLSYWSKFKYKLIFMCWHDEKKRLLNLGLLIWKIFRNRENLLIWSNFINISTPFFRAWRESAVTCGKHCNFFTPSAKGLVFCWNGYKAWAYRYRPRFFDQVGHQTTSAYIENRHFFTKSCHRQTYQNMNILLKVCKICTFKVIFWHQKSTESFWIFFLWRIFD